MFVRKLVEKASSKKPGGGPDGLKASEVDPVLVFHYGVPSSCTRFAYDSIQRILAVSTKDGRIKLFGPDNSQAMLQSDEAGSSKYLKFINNQGILLNVTLKNQIEAWDVDKKMLSHVYDFEGDITAIEILEPSLYIYVGNSAGNSLVLKFDGETGHLSQMKYTIPFAVSHGNENHLSSDSSVVQILPQPTAESKRVLIIFKDGLITLWDIHESKPIFTTGGNTLPVVNSERKQATCACWACPFGSKIAVGYSTGDIFLWSIPGRIELTSDHGHQVGPLCKLNLGYKLERVPILLMKWVHGDGRTSRLYTIGASDISSTNLVQVVLLNDHTESRTIKLGLQLAEPCIGMEIITRSSEQNKRNQDLFLAIGKSGQVLAYDDSSIEKYLLQSQSKSSPSLPREVAVKLPYADSVISISRLIMDDNEAGNLDDEVKNIPSLFTFDKNAKDRTGFSFSGFSKVKYLYITGHTNGCINFWDGACPFSPILSLEQQDQGDFALSGTAITALYFDKKSRLLVAGDKSGMVRFFKFKPEAYISGNTRKGNNHLIDGVKVLKLNGTILSMNISKNTGHIAVGSDQGQVSLIDVEGPSTLCTESIQSGISSGVIALQFASCSLHGFEKNILVVATRDSSVLALDSDNGKMLASGMVHPKKPSKALFMEVFVDGCTMPSGMTAGSSSDPAKGTSAEDFLPRQALLVLCSEKAVYIYSLNHVAQGVKKVVYKKKFQSVSCCWASTFYAPAPGLILLFTSGKIEIRSLPELVLLKEASMRGFTYSESSISSSQDGQILMVNGDQEISLFSVVQQKNMYRPFISVGQVYRKTLNHQEGTEPVPVVPKEKKKGLFSSVFGETKASKEKQGFDAEREDPRESFERLPSVFSTANFPCEAPDGTNQGTDNDNRHDLGEDEDNTDINIDDIDLDDFEEKPRGQNMFAGLNKKNLSSKFQSFKGKLKSVKAKNDKNCSEEEQQDEKIGAVDQIKKKYGFAAPSESTSAAKMAENKLQENLRKLQGISLKSTQMQDTARSFSAMAKEVLRTAEQDKRSL